MGKEQFLKGVHHYLRLISLYLNNKEDQNYEVNDGKLAFFLKLSKGHSLSALCYQTLKNTKVKIDADKLIALESKYAASVKKGMAFDQERKELYQYLNDHEIDFLPLKGIVLKDYYPDPYVREFADNDILFTASKMSVVKAFFKKKDYKVEAYKKGNHDVYIKKPFYNFEMHRSLFFDREDNARFVDYYEGILEKTPIKENHQHHFTNEDFYIYFTAHSYKHFHNAGCGIRTLVDYYLFLKNNKLDFAYINQELAKLDLLDFSNQISSLSMKVFNDEPLNEDEEEMLLFIASSGTYGTFENLAAKGVEEKGKFRYLMSRIFPPLSYYKMVYPWAYKCRILIPVAWIARFFRILFKNSKGATAEIKAITKQKEEKKK